jgi:hypothetical protein
MKISFALLTLAITLATSGFAQTVQVTHLDGNLSIDVANVTAGRLMRLLDEATGMKSSIPPSLAGKDITIHFDNLPVDKAVQTIFDNLKFDYVFVKGQGVVVTGDSERATAEAEPAPDTTAEVVTETPEETGPPSPAQLAAGPRRPPLIATPFGPIVDRGNPVVYLPPIPTAPPPIPFFAPPLPMQNASPTYSGPISDVLFRPISVYENPSPPPIYPPPPPSR